MFEMIATSAGLQRAESVGRGEGLNSRGDLTRADGVANMLKVREARPDAARSGSAESAVGCLLGQETLDLIRR